MTVRYKGSWIPDRVKVRITYIDLAFDHRLRTVSFVRNIRHFSNKGPVPLFTTAIKYNLLWSHIC